MIGLKKVITYGTFDWFHYGHQNLLKRAKELGDYLIVGVTSADFDVNRGKLNVQQSLMERIKNVKESGYADEIIVEEYEGQKIDDIQKYDPHIPSTVILDFSFLPTKTTALPYLSFEQPLSQVQITEMK